MKEIKIVTAFFDIGRAESEVYPRTNEQYFEYFSVWARIKNDLIVYCNHESAVKVREIRDNYGLSEKTQIIEIENVFDIEKQIYERMILVEKDSRFTNFRYYDKALSNRANYTYVVLMKGYFLQDAGKRISDDCMLCWLDFGFNHGNKLYTNPEDFSFEWKWEFPDKINIFCLYDPDTVSGIDSLQFQIDCITGASVVLPKRYADVLWEYMKGAMNALLSLDCIDDD